MTEVACQCISAASGEDVLAASTLPNKKVNVTRREFVLKNNALVQQIVKSPLY